LGGFFSISKKLSNCFFLWKVSRDEAWENILIFVPASSRFMLKVTQLRFYLERISRVGLTFGTIQSHPEEVGYTFGGGSG
jgi:hypothetical protein